MRISTYISTMSFVGLAALIGGCGATQPPQAERQADAATQPPRSVGSTDIANTISAQVINVVPKGSGAEVILNRGEKHGVRVGDSGFVGDVRLSVVRVFVFRSDAVTDATAEEVQASIRKASATVLLQHNQSE